MAREPEAAHLLPSTVFGSSIRSTAGSEASTGMAPSACSERRTRAKTAQLDRLETNGDVEGFELDAVEMARIGGMSGR